MGIIPGGFGVLVGAECQAQQVCGCEVSVVPWHGDQQPSAVVELGCMMLPGS